MLDNVQVGFNGAFDWNQEYSRISFLKSFNSLVIVPALHRNTISFIGMKNRECYLATKVIKDKFIALDTENNMFSWNICTGKLNEVHKIANGRDYSTFKVFKNALQKDEDHTYNRDWYSKVLLMSKSVNKESESPNYLDTDDCYTQVRNQTTFVES